MSIEMGIAIGILMLLGNAFFVGAEFGLVSARRSKIEPEALNGSRSARYTLSAMENVSLMLAGAQMGVTVCSLVLGAVSEPVIAHMIEQPLHSLGVAPEFLHPVSLVIALAIVVYLHVVIGEMVPKNLALASPTKTALILTPPLLLIVTICKPLVVFLNIIANGCLRLLGVTPRQEVASSFNRDEVAGFIKESHREGLLSRDEEHIISSALQLSEQTVHKVLLPYEVVVGVTRHVTPAEIELLSVKTGFSRFPMRDADEKLVGYVHLKDIVEIDEKQYDDALPSRYIWPLVSLKTSDTLRDALVTMQHSGTHIAQIKSGNGRAVGIVMLEDVLEELVGAIKDGAQVIDIGAR